MDFCRRWRALPWVISTLILLTASGQPPARADDPDNCLLCHRYRGLSRFDRGSDRVHLFFVNPEYGAHRLGPHARLACTDCHARAEVSVVPHLAPSPVDCAKTCHLGSPTRLERLFSHGNVQEMLKDSAHAPDALNRLSFQDGALLRAGQSECLYCHDEPLFRDPVKIIPRFAEMRDRITDRCDVCHGQSVPVDIDYALHHVTSRLQPARPALEMAQVCAVCHSDPKVLEERHLPNSVASFVRSFHGKAALLGDDSTANCLSCHVSAGDNAHRMLSRKDPRSSVNVTRIADSCRSTQCHPGADPQIADAAVHLDLPSAQGTLEYAIAAAFVVLTLLTFGPSALLVLLDLLQELIGRSVSGEYRTRAMARRLWSDPNGRRRLTRISVHFRIEHWILAILFVLLVLTGFPMKYAEQPWSGAVVRAFGGLAMARRIHHVCGIALVVGFAVHMIEVAVIFARRSRELRRDGVKTPARAAFTSLPMWITPADARKSRQLFAYLLFLRKDRPTFGRFSPTEKFEYLGVFWGTVLLGITGILLWAEQTSSHFLSGRVLNIASIAHTFEAFLAVIHVGILHTYNVILAPRVFPLSPATLTGQTPVAKLAEEHGELLEDVARDLGLAEDHGAA